MKHLLFFCLLIAANTANSQSRLLIKILLGEDRPAKGVEIRMLNSKMNPITTLTTDEQGMISYQTDQEGSHYLDIHSNDLNFKSRFERVSVGTEDTTYRQYYLRTRDPEEVTQIKQGLQKRPEEGPPKAGVMTCPDYISGTKDTATLKEVYSCLISNLSYPQQAQDWELQGKLKIKFIVNENGLINNIELMNSSFAILEEEALRAAACLTGLSPATCDGKKVPTYYMLPVSFRLE